MSQFAFYIVYFTLLKKQFLSINLLNLTTDFQGLIKSNKKGQITPFSDKAFV